jgi:putative ABC transport system permease protein
MFRNYLAAALRNLVRNRLYSAISIVGLVVGFAASLLIALFVTDEYSYDSWIPGHDRIYGLSATFTYDNRLDDMVAAHLAAWLRDEVREVEAVGRLAPIPGGLPGMPLRLGESEILDNAFYWGDATFFDVIPLPVVAGDPKAALQRPDGIVLTREAARRLFGREIPLGETLLVDGTHPMTVGAVIEDLPPNSHFAINVIASGKAPFSELAKFDANPNPRFGDAYTYVRLAPNASSAEFSKLLPQILDRHTGLTPDRQKTSEVYRLSAVPIAAIHLSPGDLQPMKPRGDRDGLLAMVLVGALIVIVASLNFVCLATARTAIRSLEVAVRKTCGAQWHLLVLQFLGETIITAVIGSIVAIIVVALLNPPFAALVGRSLSFERFWTVKTAAASMGFMLSVAVAAGSYPAFVLAAFRPAITLRGTAHAPGTGRMRRAFVIFQFAVLIALVLATIAIHRQVLFAEDEAMRFDKSQVLLIDTTCTSSFPEAVRRLPGVLDARCSGWMLSGQDIGFTKRRDDGTRLTFALMNAAPGLFELYGIKPTAGRPFSDTDTKALILNEEAVRYLGYPSDAAIIGEYPLGEERGEVIGIIPDLLMRSVRDPVKPTIYPIGFGQRTPFSILNVKLRGDHLPETLRAIDATWRATGDRPGPISRRFFDQYVQSLYIDTTRQGELFGAFAGTAIFLASLGLFGLTAFTVERRTKEIGIRKAMGASKGDILRQLLWEFAKPVLWANTIAWPIGYFLIKRWLEGFAYHVALEPWIFLAASGAALVIALVTVSGHALLLARRQPVAALRYE